MSSNFGISLDSKISKLINDRSLFSSNPKKKSESLSKFEEYLSEYLEEQRRLQETFTEEDFFKLQKGLFQKIQETQDLQKQQLINKSEQAKALWNKETLRLKQMSSNLLFKIAKEKGMITALIKSVMLHDKLLKKRLKAYYQYRRRRRIRAAARRREEEQSDWDYYTGKEKEEKEAAELEELKKAEEELERATHHHEPIFRFMTDKELLTNANNTSKNVTDAISLMSSTLKLEGVISSQEIESFQKELAHNLFKLDKTTSPEAFEKGLDEHLFKKLDHWHARTKNHLHPHEHGRHKILDDCFREIEKDILKWIQGKEVKPRFEVEASHKQKSREEQLKANPNPVMHPTTQSVSVESGATTMELASNEEQAKFERMRHEQEQAAAAAQAATAHSTWRNHSKNLAKEVTRGAKARAQPTADAVQPPEHAPKRKTIPTPSPYQPKG